MFLPAQMSVDGLRKSLATDFVQIQIPQRPHVIRRAIKLHLTTLDRYEYARCYPFACSPTVRFWSMTFRDQHTQQTISVEYEWSAYS